MKAEETAGRFERSAQSKMAIIELWVPGAGGAAAPRAAADSRSPLRQAAAPE